MVKEWSSVKDEREKMNKIKAIMTDESLQSLAEKVENTRRQVRVSIPQWVVNKLVMNGGELHIRVVKGIPPSAEFVREYYDVLSGDVVFVFRDDSFEVVPEGEVVPMFHQVIELIKEQHEE